MLVTVAENVYGGGRSWIRVHGVLVKTNTINLKALYPYGRYLQKPPDAFNVGNKVYQDIVTNPNYILQVECH